MTQDEKDDAAIANAILLGAEFAYDDFGHPERADARKYWTAHVHQDCKISNAPRAYGYTKGGCARDWLWLHGYDVNWDGTITRWFTPPNNNPTE